MAIAADMAHNPSPSTDRLERHPRVDRLFHWLTALAVLALMATGLLPRVGVHLDWISIHWITRLALLVLVTFHIVRSLIWQRFRTMWFGAARLPSAQRGKYSVAQKLMHHAMGLMVLGAVVTGVLMLKKIKTPFLMRDPYFLSADDW